MTNLELLSAIQSAVDKLPFPWSQADKRLMSEIGRQFTGVSPDGTYCLHEKPDKTIQLIHDVADGDIVIRGLTLVKNEVVDLVGFGDNLNEEQRVAGAIEILRGFILSKPRLRVVGAMKGVHMNTIKL